jgi:hypothetical protein
MSSKKSKKGPAQTPKSRPARPERPKSASSALSDAKLRMARVRLALNDFAREDPERRTAGLHDVIVYGRTVTWVLQGLRYVVPEFDQWYDAKEQTVLAAPVCKYFTTVRNRIEKEGNFAIVESGEVTDAYAHDLHMRYAAPPGWSLMMGRPGAWWFEGPHGDRIPIQAASGVHHGLFVGRRRHPVNPPPELEGVLLETMIAEYVTILADLVGEALDRWGHLP